MRIFICLVGFKGDRDNNVAIFKEAEQAESYLKTYYQNIGDVHLIEEWETDMAGNSEFIRKTDVDVLCS